MKTVLKKWKSSGCADAVKQAVTEAQPDAAVQSDLSRLEVIDAALALMKKGLSTRGASAWCLERNVKISHVQLHQRTRGERADGNPQQVLTRDDSTSGHLYRLHSHCFQDAGVYILGQGLC